MLPTEEERSRIQEAQAANPDLPLGSAEQFLLTLASISELPARLKLWAFKLDFENSEKVSYQHSRELLCAGTPVVRCVHNLFGRKFLTDINLFAARDRNARGECIKWKYCVYLLLAEISYFPLSL